MSTEVKLSSGTSVIVYNPSDDDINRSRTTSSNYYSVLLSSSLAGMLSWASRGIFLKSDY